ncbi:MAG: phosphoribosylformylglycinamidine synthase [Bacteroidales bacterium]|nr:phosphoribosylformylglycinamidine synthase [Bacteroidales bacterium]
MIRRIYVEKKEPYAVRAKELIDELTNYLGINATKVRIAVRYDIEGMSDSTYSRAKETIFSEPPVDDLHENSIPTAAGDFCFTVEYLPGQFDQRADSAEQCSQLLEPAEHPIIRSATTYIISGGLTEEQRRAIVAHCVNPVDSRVCGDELPTTLAQHFEEPTDVKTIDGLRQMNEESLLELYNSLNLAMTFNDFKHIQHYFIADEQRDPSITEIRVLDTYWSDHCRHTTFATELTDIKLDNGYYRPLLEKALQSYLDDHKQHYAGRTDKYVCLMDIGTLAAKRLRKQGLLPDWEVSDEINACSIIVPVTIDGKEEEWLVNFKNETHNHPTEIEPFGGAATCLGGCIRDPLSGRTYVYQAMRVTGAADPTKPVAETLKGKLPQRKIVTTAARGYSSYGNQIGLATGIVSEVYHPGYVAKRMEIGAVIAAAPRKQVKRLTSDPGDIIILLGGRTGRDGIGGATGASKSHNSQSLTSCGAEVQKGNAPTERKIQRLFRRPEVASIIKKCNDFGAGGVSVAIGELADGLLIDLDKVPKKYAGLDGTELAISESQERMAVVVDPANVDTMMRYADEENLEATIVAQVTKEPRMVMTWRGKTIVDLSRRFIDTNGAHQESTVAIAMPANQEHATTTVSGNNIKERWLGTLADLNVCSQKGLVEMFDSTVGAGSVVMPYGGKHQLTPTQSMIGKLPVLKGDCDAVSIMAYGLDPYTLAWSPFHGAVWSIVNSVAKIAAAGGDVSKVRLTFQEYFKKLGTDPYRWGEPTAALLGAYYTQKALQLPAIGGKDSMSGTFNDIDVPPTLCSFAVGMSDLAHVVTPELKNAGNKLYVLGLKVDLFGMPDIDHAKQQYAELRKAIEAGSVVSTYVIGAGGIVEALSKMAFGNKLGVQITNATLAAKLQNGYQLHDFTKYGNIVLEVKPNASLLPSNCTEIGIVHNEPVISVNNECISLDEALSAWQRPLEEVFPTKSSGVAGKSSLSIGPSKSSVPYICRHKVAKPRVFIPAFPGTNCEYDSARTWDRAGAESHIVVFRNQNGSQIEESVKTYVDEIKQSQIVMLPGGFSAGDEPDGSAKFITSVFRNAMISEAVMDLLNNRDGLMLGICNGFQALVKLGLVPYGEIREQTANAPTLTFNTIGRHQSMMARTRIASTMSPWLQQVERGSCHTIPISHGEGRFVASDEVVAQLFANNQVATQYVDLDGNPTMEEPFNMNGSTMAIEGITSPDGRVLGKMGHSERRSRGTALNIPGNDDERIFESGVAYFK